MHFPISSMITVVEHDIIRVYPLQCQCYSIAVSLRLETRVVALVYSPSQPQYEFPWWVTCNAYSLLTPQSPKFTFQFIQSTVGIYILCDSSLITSHAFIDLTSNNLNKSSTWLIGITELISIRYKLTSRKSDNIVKYVIISLMVNNLLVCSLPHLSSSFEWKPSYRILHYIRLAQIHTCVGTNCNWFPLR